MRNAMRNPIFAATSTACIIVSVSAAQVSAQAVQPTGTIKPPAAEKIALEEKSASKCLADLRSFDAQMEKDGYWLAGSGFGLGYPSGEVGYGAAYPTGGSSVSNAGLYRTARPGYEVRVLLASAHVLARHGQQEPCENLLSLTRDVYKVYVSQMESGKLPMADLHGWRERQIVAAQPVTENKTPFRSDELLGTDVRNPQDQALGSVEDIVMSPETGKVAYLVIGRGGLFGFDEKYVPVPWGDFKISPNANLLVLDATKATMSAAPEVGRNRFSHDDHFDQESAKVDSYWKLHTGSKINN